MSIFKFLDANIEKSRPTFEHYLAGMNSDVVRGAEFMFYALMTIFKDKDLAEIEAGIVDASYREEKYDFGIDAVFITASGEFLEEIEQINEYNEDTKFIIHILQFKRGTGVAQQDFLKLQAGVQKVLIDEKLTKSDNLYFHDRMVLINKIKNKLYENFSSDNINVEVHTVFGGLESNIKSETILTEALDNITDILSVGGFINSENIITDCESLITIPSRSGQIIDIIEYQKTFNYITDVDHNKKLNGYISIIRGKEVAELVRRHQGAIFEANIRDYYRRNDLNSKIIETSSSGEESKFFWSYNNGLTMTCSKVEEMPNNRYKLHNLQIVNGCQTSNAIYLALKNRERVRELLEKQEELESNGKELTKKDQSELNSKVTLQFNESTTLLVKIIETNDEDFIYRITETTNSQTPIKTFSLRANDDIQKLIEKYLETNGISYERRINSLRNAGKKNVISIQRLFQLYTSQILLKPSQVRTKPKRMFLSSYDSVFPTSEVKLMNYALYLIPIKVDLALNGEIAKYMAKKELDNYTKKIISYGKLHLGCFILSSILKNQYDEKNIVKKESYIIKQLETNINVHIEDAIKNFKKILKGLKATTSDSIPNAVRQPGLDTKIARLVKNRKN